MITPAMIEAAAAASWNLKCLPDHTWNRIPENWKPFYRDQAKAALKAAMAILMSAPERSNA